MKRYLYASILCFIAAAFAGRAMADNYVLMALQAQTDGEGVEYYQLINGAQTVDVPATKSLTLATSGQWRMVLFLIDQIKPAAWSTLQAADWLRQADGFLGFDFRMLYEGERLGASITNRTFDYAAVLNAVIRIEWWTESEGIWTRTEGSRAEWAAAGYPRTSRVMPMPHYLGNPEDTY